MKPSLYVNSKGWPVSRHSYSGSESFTFCARKYYLERVQGWTEKIERSSKFFGIAVEKAVTFYHQHRLDAPGAVAEFARLWAEHKNKNYTYSKSDLDWDRLNLSGQELVKLYTIRYPKMPYVVNNPQDFQVETNLEVFPGTELAGLEFTSFIDLIAQMKDGFAPIIIDMKTSGKDIPELTVLDPQLRSYAWVKSTAGGIETTTDSEGKKHFARYTQMWDNVAFLWFRKCGRTISKGDTVALLEPRAGLQPGDEAIVLATDDFGIWVTKNRSLVDDIDTKFEGRSKAVLASRQQFIEENAKHVPESVVTKQQVQFKMVKIAPESAEDIGHSIKKDIVNIVAAKNTDFYPMQSGVRFPNEKCVHCAMRGICADIPALRDELVARKHQDDLFESDAE
jgi:hypothetical protein